MNVRTFHVKSMHEAIRAIKEALGPEAVILSTKRVRSWGNGFGLLGGSMLEVVAANDEESDAGNPPVAREGEIAERAGAEHSAVSATGATPFEHTLRGAMVNGAVREPAPKKGPTQDKTPAGVGFFVRNYASRAGTSGIESFERVYDDLLAHGVEAETAEQCLRELQATLVEPGQSGKASSLQLLRTVLLSRITTVGPLLAPRGDRKVALFIGPSGVGKTSTIAKLATHYGLVEQRSVVLITMDTFRPAAVEQLRLYAEVLGIDLRVAGTSDEVRAAIDESREAELVLIDTPGLLPYQPLEGQRWRDLVKAGYPLEIHLVMAAGTRVPDLVATVSNCIDLPALRLLFTKLDETRGYGGIFETTHRTGVPLSYWGTGQRVPDDLVLARVERLGDLLLGGHLWLSGAATVSPAGQADMGMLSGTRMQ
ncbi:MAG TPA: flagellar biosynthesis protein FlhF [Nitrospiraceae bacterium]|nr:flagellar biosynthesis protein FlhF [Nitrospiraceae bacterium]